MSKLIIPECYAPVWWWLDSNVPSYRYFVLEGGRASGKSTTVAQSLICRASIQPITVLCAREFQNSISDSVMKLLEEQIEELGLTGFTVLRDSITHENGSSFIFRGLHNNIQSIKSIQSIDVAWIEEAQTVSKNSLNVLIPTIRNANSTLIFTLNPLTEHDPVLDRFVYQPSEETAANTFHVHTTWKDIENMLNPAILQMVEESKNSPDFQHVWEGQPQNSLVNQLITYDMLNQAKQRQPNGEGMTVFGVDVARYGNDRTAVAINTANTLTDLVSWTHSSIVESAERIRTLASNYNLSNINIDDTGIGGGLTDILKNWGLPVNPINYAQKAKQPNKYPNIASELWFNFAETLNTISINPTLDTSELFNELTNREWTINNKNQRCIQNKQAYKQQNESRSPDLADSVLLAFYKPVKQANWNITI